MTKIPAIICDIDGTLANVKHRIHLIVNPEGKVDWPAWDALAHLDTPFAWCVELIRAMKARGTEIIFLTGRGDRCREATTAWLREYVGDWATREPLIMRDNKDFRKDTIYKTEAFEQQIAPHYNVLFALDDRDSVADMWRELGITCLHCDKLGEEGEKGHANYLKESTPKKDTTDYSSLTAQQLDDRRNQP